MRRLLAAAVLALVASVGWASAAPDAIQIRVNNGVLFRVEPGVTAAYTLDASVADASLRDGAVTLYGISAGETTLVLVTATTTQMLNVAVIPAASIAPAAGSIVPPRRAVAESRYSSGAAQVTNSLDVFTPNSALHVINVHYLQERYGSLSDAFPSISWQFKNVTLFDAPVDNSPLTLNNATLRGVHVERGGWQVHAGYTAAAFYDGVILPADRQTAAGVSYSRQIAPAWRLMPSIYAFPSHDRNDPSHRGAVASLLVAYAPDDRLHLVSELGFSRGAGAAVQLSSVTDSSRLRADLRWQPRDFAIVGPNSIRGLYSDVAWDAHVGRLTADTTFSWNDYLLPHFEQRSITSSVDLREQLSERFALLGGARYSAFEGRVPATAQITNVVVPAGAAIDFAHAGATALVRFGRHSADGTTRGFRITGRASAGGFSATAYVDRQNDTPTLQLIFQQRPDLALALERLGFEATSPDDIARLLRDNAPLFTTGIIEGASVNLTPHRDQAGLELTWTDSSAARQRLRLRIFENRLESVASTTTSRLAMLSYARRIAAATDIEATVARFSVPARNAVEIAMRHSFDDVPRLGGGEISGRVTLDETQNGVAGVDVQLDASRVAQTDARGRYAFSHVGGGTHQVIARLPRPDAYFTGASRVDATAGEVVDFGLALAAARIAGRVVSDAGLGVGGVRVAIVAAGRRFTATTDSDGNFAVMGAKGTWSAEVDADSLPDGYTAGEKLQLNAIRTITGQVLGGVAEVEVRPLGRRITTDAEGHFAFRALPAGEITLVARAGARAATRTITLPPQPATVTDVELVLRPQSEQVSGGQTSAIGPSSRK